MWAQSQFDDFDKMITMTMAMTILIIIFRASKVNTSLTLDLVQHREDGGVQVGELVLLLLLLLQSGGKKTETKINSQTD